MGINTTKGNSNAHHTESGVSNGHSEPADGVNTDGFTQNITGMGSDLFGMGSVIPNNRGSLTLSSVHDGLKKIYAESVDPAFTVAVHKLDNTIITELKYSLVIVYVQLKSSKKAAFHTLLISSTGPSGIKLSEIPTAVGSTPNILVPSDAMDHVVFNKVTALLKSVYPNVTLSNTEGTVIPANADFSDTDSLYTVAASTAKVCQADLSVENKDVSVGTLMKDVVASNASLHLELTTNRGTITNAVGSPVRHSWLMQLAMINSSNQVTQSLNNESNRNLQRVVGYVDVLPVNTETVTPGAYTAPAIRFKPVIVITGTSSVSPSLATFLLSLSNVMALTSNQAWMQCLKPAVGDPLHDPGGLNIQANINNEKGLGRPIDLSKSNDPDTIAILRRLVVNDPLVCVDIDTYGPDTAIALAFTALTNPDTAGNAMAAIMDACNKLTNNKFNNTYKGTVIVNSVTLPTGDYTDKDGVVRDIREIDYLAMANTIGVKNPVDLRHWSILSVTDGGNPAEARIRILDLIKKVIPDANITGWRTRNTIDPEFIKALSSALASDGFKTRLTAPNTSSSIDNLDIIQDFMRTSGVGGYTPGFFNQGGLGGGNVPYHAIPGIRRYV